MPKKAFPCTAEMEGEEGENHPSVIQKKESGSVTSHESVKALIQRSLTVNDLLLAVPHHMNVFNANELQLDVGVVILILVAFSSCSISHCVELWTHTHASTRTHQNPECFKVKILLLWRFSGSLPQSKSMHVRSEYE